jgi:hypothetical protein
MGITLERDSNGKMNLNKGGRRDGRMDKKRILSIGLSIALVAIVLTGISAALAEGDKVRHTHGEDDGYYDVNNCNPYDDDDFPGVDEQNRTGVVV